MPRHENNNNNESTEIFIKSLSNREWEERKGWRGQGHRAKGMEINNDDRDDDE